MKDSERNKRVRMLVSELNKARKKQAAQIDILCNDFISAQRQFVGKLGQMCFVSQFYELLIGKTELPELIDQVSKFVSSQLAGVDPVVFVRGAEGFDLHVQDNSNIGFERDHLEEYFTTDILESICGSNKVWDIEDMFGAGLEGNLKKLRDCSIAAIPIGGDMGSAVGVMVLFGKEGKKFVQDEIEKLSAAMLGLSKAVETCGRLVRAQGGQSSK